MERIAIWPRMILVRAFWSISMSLWIFRCMYCILSYSLLSWPYAFPRASGGEYWGTYSKSEGGWGEGGEGGDGGDGSASPLGMVQVAHKNKNASRISPLLPSTRNANSYGFLVVSPQDMILTSPWSANVIGGSSYIITVETVYRVTCYMAGLLKFFLKWTSFMFKFIFPHELSVHS